MNYIGIDEDVAAGEIKALNSLLASYQVFYQNLRGFHWNIKGEKFFGLHEKFEEYYTAAAEDIDAIAERILTIGGAPLHSISQYLKESKIREVTEVSEARTAVESILEQYIELVNLERPILDQSAEANDEGTNSLISDLLAKQEKTIWMLSSWLK
ncbi:Dps family protein [Imperialibacter roseus]|uniref:Dps family protein n=1 Tax=Imperialibacter roseus TaxID=1324217 RepID=A0ABZ0IP17_9BACT|nr:Dps family protein [Imperialibacter roseus]WOK06778.1 Dps family protein [Imperialibacter roseus]